VCDYTTTVDYYTNPTSVGTINGYSNGGSQTHYYNNYNCNDDQFQYYAKADPSLGYAFSYWSVSGGTMSSTSSDPAYLTMSADTTADLTANFVPLPDIMNTFYCDSGGCTTDPPPGYNTTKVTTFSGTPTETCGTMGGYSLTVPFCMLQFSATVNGTSYEALLWAENMTNCQCSQANGNSTISIGLAETSGGDWNVTASAADFVYNNGTVANLGDNFYLGWGGGADLAEMLVNAESVVSSQASTYGSSGNSTLINLSHIYKSISYSAGDLSSYLSGSGPDPTVGSSFSFGALSWVNSPYCNAGAVVTVVADAGLILVPPSGGGSLAAAGAILVYLGAIGGNGLLVTECVT
jgi:hypothetical protein